MNSRKKAQSAMEYLMSYGWAILIIAVVLGVLFQLGVFSGSALAPKAQAGACQVQRLLGQVSLEGECQGQLPEFVGQFNGASSYISYSNPATTSQIQTTSAWIFTPTPSGTNMYFIDQGGNNNWMQVYLDGIRGGTGQFQGYCDSTAKLQANTWYFVTRTYNGLVGSIYVNGTLSCSNSQSGFTPTVLTLGEYSGIGEYFNGKIANVQIYNTSLSANEIQALYLEGIGGAPIKLQNLVGWWPLNGNANDYSGNNHNGATTSGVSFNNTWNSQYTPP